jgi:hypothetical protein
MDMNEYLRVQAAADERDERRQARFDDLVDALREGARRVDGTETDRWCACGAPLAPDEGECRRCWADGDDEFRRRADV